VTALYVMDLIEVFKILKNTDHFDKKIFTIMVEWGIHRSYIKVDII